jgi:hypothetical protein
MYFFRAFMKELKHEMNPKKLKHAYIEKDKLTNNLPSGKIFDADDPEDPDEKSLMSGEEGLHDAPTL